MVEITEQRSLDIRELKQQLNTAKEQRMDLVIKLGELTHIQLRENDANLSLLKDISNKIIHKDVIIYQTQNAIAKLTPKQHQCSNCQHSIEESAKFCGNCGTLNTNFKDENAVQVICNACEQLFEEQHLFCPCCGVKQEAK